MSVLTLRLFNPTHASDDSTQKQSGLTLSQVYELLIPQLPPELSPRSLSEQRTALRHWVSATDDPVLGLVDSRVIARLRDHLVGKGLEPPTVNKIWRTLRSFFRFAVEELHAIERVPSLAYRSRSKLLREAVPIQRENVSHDEIAQLWRNCERATYPRFADRAVTVRLWRTFLVMLHTYGMRSGDLIDLPRSAILWNDHRVRWAADKTDKLQGLPLTETAEYHLRAWLAVAPAGERLFEGLNRAGHYDRSSGTWSPGYYTTWRREIAAGIDPEIHWQDFRTTVVTEFNNLAPGVGGWVAGHSQPGVTERHYDKPSQRVREAFKLRAAPPCFLAGWHNGTDSDKCTCESDTVDS